MTTQPSTGPRPRTDEEPRTEAGRELVEAIFAMEGGMPVDPGNVVLAIEAEARAAALTAVEEAVRATDGWQVIRSGHGSDHSSAIPSAAKYRDRVLAVLAKLQEDALHPADKEAETSHE